jgi:hypothetical protein
MLSTDLSHGNFQKLSAFAFEDGPSRYSTGDRFQCTCSMQIARRLQALSLLESVCGGTAGPHELAGSGFQDTVVEI